MTILTFPVDLQEAVFQIVPPPTNTDNISITIKVDKTIDEKTLAKLKTMGVKYLQPV